MDSFSTPFWDLFEVMRPALKLSLADYEALVTGVMRGYGAFHPEGQWTDLRELCRVLWVKDHGTTHQTFDRLFERYVTQKRQQVNQQFTLPPAEHQDLNLGKLPTLPPRKKPRSPSPPVTVVPPAQNVPTAAFKQSPNSLVESKFGLQPTELPIAAKTLGRMCQALRPRIARTSNQLDVSSTLRSIYQKGLFADLVYHQDSRSKPSLLLLMDDNNGMQPFGPALEPFVELVALKMIQPIWIYQYIGYPVEYVYQLDDPAQEVPIDDVLVSLSKQNTTALIISDAGAATHNNRASLQDGILNFLTKLKNNVCDLIWINPLPEARWRYTCADSVNQFLDGEMQCLDALTLSKAQWER